MPRRVTRSKSKRVACEVQEVVDNCACIGEGDDDMDCKCLNCLKRFDDRHASQADVLSSLPPGLGRSSFGIEEFFDRPVLDESASNC